MPYVRSYDYPTTVLLCISTRLKAAFLMDAGYFQCTAAHPRDYLRTSVDCGHWPAGSLAIASTGSGYWFPLWLARIFLIQVDGDLGHIAWIVGNDIEPTYLYQIALASDLPGLF